MNHLVNFTNIQFGGLRPTFLILNTNDETTNTKYSNFITSLRKLGKIMFHSFNFRTTNFTLDDLLFENIATDMYEKYNHEKYLLIIAFEHCSPYALYYANKYKCAGVICFPLRLYTEQSLQRRYWKYEKNNGWYNAISKKYGYNDFYKNIDNDRLQEIITNSSNQEEKIILMLILDHELMKQYDKIPTLFTVPTFLFARLDINTKGIVSRNFDRTDIANMKGILTENDALQQSCIWNFARVDYDNMLLELNKNNDNLRIQYIMMDNEYVNDYDDLLDSIKLMTNDM
jgi:hypothetical protein